MFGEPLYLYRAPVSQRKRRIKMGFIAAPCITVNVMIWI